MKRIETTLVETQWTDGGADVLISAKVTAICCDEAVSPSDWQISAGFVDNAPVLLKSVHEAVRIAEGETQALRIIGRVENADSHPFAVHIAYAGVLVGIHVAAAERNTEPLPRPFDPFLPND